VIFLTYPEMWQKKLFWKDIDDATLEKYQLKMRPLDLKKRRREIFTSKFTWKKISETNKILNPFVVQTKTPMLTSNTLQKMVDFYDIDNRNISIHNDICHFAMLDPKWETIAQAIKEKISFL